MRRHHHRRQAGHQVPLNPYTLIVHRRSFDEATLTAGRGCSCRCRPERASDFSVLVLINSAVHRSSLLAH